MTSSCPTDEFGPERQTVLDVAAASGQLSVLLAQEFDHVVIAMDKSERQLAHAKKNIRYQVGNATQLPNSEQGEFYDAITVAQAYHWFLKDTTDQLFLQEARRVLHPSHGIVGIFGYGICAITNNDALHTVFQHEFYHQRLKSHCAPKDSFWNVDRRLVDHAFAELPTYNSMEIIVQRHYHKQTESWTRHQFLDYVRTFSGLVNLRQHCAQQQQQDPMEWLHQQFTSDTTEEEEESLLLEVEFPFFLIVLKPVHKKPETK
ncbi:Methyltransferase domain [Seminavis robusta]|uniref:Methyltransferase domain n=1 Tax=Seminavis robusta TaxID=568900 RepID=A0A9N8D9B7_9STRA|nr:Methyltransferase domain [Seminavis robusta]|eukprot:Sro39_g024330.1 Methyltransferase domain (260) ;mRNA; r:141483-142342